MAKLKQSLAILLSLALLLSLLPQMALFASAETYSGKCGDNLTWSFDEATGVLTITGSGAMEDYTRDSASWNDYSADITEVKLPDGLTSIGDWAFSDCSSLATITIPGSVTSIGLYAFYRCSSIASVTIPNGVRSIGSSAFTECSSLTSVTIGNDVTSIGSYSFQGCSSLTSVTIPEGVTSIGPSAFSCCSSLESVTIPASVTSIGIFAFDETAIMKNADYWQGKLLYINGWLISAEHDIQEAMLKENTVGIADSAFWSCSALKSVTIPDSVTIIGESVFAKCESLASVTIPDSVTSISYAMFARCSSLASVTIPDSVTSIGENAFYGCDGLKDVYYSGDEAAWGRISIYDGNDPLKNATIYYNSTAPAFSDVSPKAYYAAAVSWAVANDVTNGTGDGKFSPNDTCTRGQVVAFLWRAFGQPKPTSTNNPFTDVKEGKYYYDAVLWAVEKGITSGTEPGKFSPNGECTRGQVVTFLWRAAGKPAPKQASNPFTDVKQGAYYYDAVFWAVEQGVTKGTTDTTFSPEQTCTRGQVVTFLFRDLA